MRYSADQRSNAKRALPNDAKPSEIIKKLGDMWKNENTWTKNRYQKLVDPEMEKYKMDAEKFKNQEAAKKGNKVKRIMLKIVGPRKNGKSLYSSIFLLLLMTNNLNKTFVLKDQ